MNTSSMYGIMDVVIVLGGLYMLYGYYLLMFKNEVRAGILISKLNEGKRCKDLEGFKKEIGPKLLIFAFTAIADGIVGLVNDFIVLVPTVIYWGFYVLFFVVLIWYVIASKKVEKKYY